jgi:hypothetical protein
MCRDGEMVVMSPLRDGSQTFVGLAFKLEVRSGRGSKVMRVGRENSLGAGMGREEGNS